MTWFGLLLDGGDQQCCAGRGEGGADKKGHRNASSGCGQTQEQGAAAEPRSMKMVVVPAAAPRSC